jgi:protein NRD1
MPIATYESRARETGTIKGLDSFDFTTFDFTSPASWEALGKAWEATNGVSPTQEMLMQFVMMSSMSMGMGMGAGGLGVGPQVNDQSEGTQGAQGPGDWTAEGMEWSDGGIGTTEETQGQGGPIEQSASLEKEDSPVFGERSVGSAGKMQKVGDRWVFVRS